MDPTPGSVTFADLLTPQGILIAAAAVTTVVEVIKAGIPAVDRFVSGATLAFLLSAILYAAAAVAIPQQNPDGYLTVLFAWVAASAGALGIRSGAAHVGEVREGTAGLTSEIKATLIEPVSHSDEDQSDEVEAELPVTEDGTPV